MIDIGQSVTGSESGGAVISECGKYRYRLWREVGPNTESRCLFVMLNPSTADVFLDDPTIRRCRSFAFAFGHGTLDVVNLFAFRATEPNDLMTAPFPVGPNNDQHILSAAKDAALIVCAWGSHKAARTRGPAVRHMLEDSGHKLHYLAITPKGIPYHPLYLAGGLKPIAWE